MYGVRAIVMGLLSPFSRIFVSSWKGVIEGDMKKLDKIYSSLGQEPNPTVPDPSELSLPSSLLLLFLDSNFSSSFFWTPRQLQLSTPCSK